eukprot:TRINITY_DN152_c0_g1_i14.p1 TRINITY_DN152_c0_g1~~TRINITY_DN152_c0_g1_i14.p1  ORF type:complete len:577 (+),score=148.86 TRINITY_DN152_c0_g1_i14:3414-5144(+)
MVEGLDNNQFNELDMIKLAISLGDDYVEQLSDYISSFSISDGSLGPVILHIVDNYIYNSTSKILSMLMQTNLKSVDYSTVVPKILQTVNYEVVDFFIDNKEFISAFNGIATGEDDDGVPYGNYVTEEFLNYEGIKNYFTQAEHSELAKQLLPNLPCQCKEILINYLGLSGEDLVVLLINSKAISLLFAHLEEYLHIILDKLIDKCAGTDKDVIMFFERFVNLSEIDVKSHLNCLLDRVVQEQKTNFIQLLLKYGADPNYSHDGTTMLLQTVDMGYLAGATLLIEHKANINQVDEDRDTPLMNAVVKDKNLPLVKLLLSNQADIKLKNNAGGTALTVAISAASAKIVKLLISNGMTIDPNWKDEEQDSQLHYLLSCSDASNKKRLELVKLLVDNHHPIDKENSKQEDPIYLAAKLQDTPILTYLLKHLSPEYDFTKLLAKIDDSSSKVTELINNFKNKKAIKVEEPEINNSANTKEIINAIADTVPFPILKHFFENSPPLEVDVINQALLKACEYGNEYSALHFAASEDEPELVELLLFNKADVNARLSDGYTPLHEAATVPHLLNVLRFSLAMVQM